MEIDWRVIQFKGTCYLYASVVMLKNVEGKPWHVIISGRGGATRWSLWAADHPVDLAQSLLSLGILAQSLFACAADRTWWKTRSDVRNARPRPAPWFLTPTARLDGLQRCSCSSGAPEWPPPAGQTLESEASNALQYLYVDPDILSLPKFYHVSLCIKWLALNC